MIVTCPECKERISGQASPCPRCGLPKAGALSKELNQYFVENFEEMERYFHPSGGFSPCSLCGAHPHVRLVRTRLVNKGKGAGYGIFCSFRCVFCGGIDSTKGGVRIAVTDEDSQFKWEKIE